MSEAKKDLAYYLTHTDEMPDDPKILESLASEQIRAALEGDSQQLTVDRFVKPDEKTGSFPAEAKPAVAQEEAKAEAQPKPDAPKEEPKEEVRPDGVLAKDGKNIIPFSVLESARERAARAEELVSAKDAEIDRLKAASGAAAAAKPAEAAKTEMLTEEELNALEADSPTLAKVLRAQQATIQRLNGTVEALAQRSEDQEKTEVAEVKSEIQAAIDANPTLAAWQADKDQTMWDEAAKFDKLLRENQRYAEVSFEDRFKKVVELTQAAVGSAEVRDVTQEPKPAATPTQAEIKAAAEAKLKAKTSLPKSLSDIPGGAPPAVDERQKVEQMSSVALGNQFLGMSKDQMDAYLATL